MTVEDTDLINRWSSVQQRIACYAIESNRQPRAITLLAVSKRHSASAIETLFTAGQHDFGENYLQEALIKQQQLQHLTINWHFIGSIQSKKCQAIAENFQWVHTVDRSKVARLLQQHRPDALPPLQVCVQVNMDNSATKAGGCDIGEVAALAQEIATLPKLQLRGLMAIPDPESMHQNPNPFQRLAQLQQQLAIPTDTLSMGMSGDMRKAVAAGATIVRIGTDIFGSRV